LYKALTKSIKAKHQAREQEKKKESIAKYKQKTTLESTECTMESPQRRNQETLRPKPITSNTKQVLQEDHQ
jgi:hypothetical protein